MSLRREKGILHAQIVYLLSSLQTVSNKQRKAQGYRIVLSFGFGQSKTLIFQLEITDNSYYSEAGEKLL